MKPRRSMILSAAIAGTSTLAPIMTIAAQPTAQAQIVGVSSRDGTQLDLYANPGDPKPARSVDVSRLPLPLVVHEARAGYLSISLEGQKVWVRSSKVRRARSAQVVESREIRGYTDSLATPGITQSLDGRKTKP